MPATVPTEPRFPTPPQVEVVRERRLHLIQLVIAVLTALAGVAVVVVAGRALVTIDNERAHHARLLSSVVHVRDRLRIQELAFWEARAAGRSEVPPVCAPASCSGKAR